MKNGKPKQDADGNPVSSPTRRTSRAGPRPPARATTRSSTSASNLGPENKDLSPPIEQRRAAAARLDGVAPAQVAPDALQASGSGLDPHISPRTPREQVARVARGAA